MGRGYEQAIRKWQNTEDRKHVKSRHPGAEDAH